MTSRKNAEFWKEVILKLIPIYSGADILELADQILKGFDTRYGADSGNAEDNKSLAHGKSETYKHDLKCENPYFEDILSGQKKFEVRKNDRDFQLGDLILLRLYKAVDMGIYSGHSCGLRITYILYGGRFGIQEGYVVLGIEKLK